MNFFEKVKRLVRWFPILWNDLDFDWRYLLEVINFKLKLMDEFFSNDELTTAEGNQEVANQIKKVREILNNFITEDWESEIYEKYWEKYPFDIENIGKEMSEEQDLEWKTLCKKREDKYNEMKEQLKSLFVDSFDNWWD